MTNFNRSTLPDTVRSNGATPNPWWANAVVYQVYPRSFQDTNGDGIGDLKGITSRLDYLADLGVDVVWLSPVYKSPQDDNGYDISDYQDIDPLFGTLEDMDELLAEAHKRGLKIVMDLVVNHTSDEHAWFQASRDKDDPHADWYWWRPAKPGHEPGTPGAEPNQWGSYFGGSAWEYDPKRGEYYLHQYSKKQPDLNWENPEVRKAVYKMMNWWMDRGIDGFRMDVITQVSKTVDKNGKLPGEDGCEIEDYPVGEEGYSSPFPWCSDGPRIDEFLAEMRREVFEGREGYMNVGEAPGITPARNEHVTDPKNGELDMLFLFDHVGIDQEGSKWNTVPFEVKNLRARLADQQEAVKNAGWASLFFCNHDQPRVVSRWGNDTDRESRELSAKAFGMLLHMHRGTPYIYEGEELGMTNCPFQSLDEFRDIDSLNGYRRWVTDGPLTHDEFFPYLLFKSRDNARTPMQWDDSTNAGFTCGTPWIRVNPNYTEVNAAAAMADPDSTFYYFQKLIRLRKTHPVIVHGRYALLEKDDPALFIYTRTLDDAQLLVMCNFKEQTREWTMPAGFAGAQVLISNTGRTQQAKQTITLQPYEALVLLK